MTLFGCVNSCMNTIQQGLLYTANPVAPPPTVAGGPPLFLEDEDVAFTGLPNEVANGGLEVLIVQKKVALDFSRVSRKRDVLKEFEKVKGIETELKINGLEDRAKRELFLSALTELDANCFENVTTLDLSNNMLKGTVFKIINRCLVSKMTSLESLDLSYNIIGPEGAKEIANLPLLTSLNLRYNNIRYEGAKEIANLPLLTSLDLGGNNIGDEGVKEIVKLTALTSLDLSSNDVRPKGAKEIVKLTALTSLSLSGNGIRPEGVKEITKLSSLESLNLSRNSIVFEGVKEIASLTSLISLNLEHNEIQKIEKDAFKNMPNLKDVRLSGKFIETIEAGAFSGLSQNMIIDLECCNQFESSNKVKLEDGPTFKSKNWDFITTLFEHQGSVFKITFPENSNLDRLLNHINNQESGSFLTAVDKIEDRDLKENLMVRLIEYLNEKEKDEYRPHTDAMLQVLCKEPYRSNETIEPFFHHLLTDFIEKANSETVALTDNIAMFICNAFSTQESLVEGSVKYESVGGALGNGKAEALINNMGFTMQLMAYIEQRKALNESGMSEQESKNIEAIEETVNTIVSDALPGKLKTLLNDTGLEINDLFLLKKDTKDSSVEWFCIKRESVNRILKGEGVIEDFQDLNKIKRESVNRILKGEGVIEDFQDLNKLKEDPRGSFFWVTFGNQNSEEMESKYQGLPILELLYEKFKAGVMFPAFIKLLKLGKYEQSFLGATKKGRCEEQEKKISQKIQEDLGVIFKKLMEGDTVVGKDGRLRAEHVENILEAFDLEKNSPDKGALFIALATVFTKYTSSAIFGTESDSPQVLRNYAMALINQAKQFGMKNIPDEWGDKLLGVKGEFTCTAVLSSSMHEWCRETKNVAPWLRKLWPAAWVA